MEKSGYRFELPRGVKLHVGTAREAHDFMELLFGGPPAQKPEQRTAVDQWLDPQLRESPQVRKVATTPLPPSDDTLALTLMRELHNSGDRELNKYERAALLIAALAAEGKEIAVVDLYEKVFGTRVPGKSLTFIKRTLGARNFDKYVNWSYGRGEDGRRKMFWAPTEHTEEAFRKIAKESRGKLVLPPA